MVTSSAEDESILSAAMATRATPDHDCKIGTCLLCVAKLVDGRVDERHPQLHFPDSPYILTCMSFPASDVVVQTLDDEDRSGAGPQKFINSIYASWRKK